MGEAYCGDVEKRVEAKLIKIEATLEKHGDALTDIRTDLAVIINRGHPPCKEYDERIKELETTRISVSSGGKVLWKTLAISGGIILGLCSVGTLIVATITLWK